jgi:hypothetical protein
VLPQSAPSQNSDEQCAVNASAAHVLVIGRTVKTESGVPAQVAGKDVAQSSGECSVSLNAPSLERVRYRAPRARAP